MLSLVENLFVKKNPLQDLLSSLNAVISTNERTEFITGHVIFKLRYNQIYQLKTTLGPLYPSSNFAHRFDNFPLRAVKSCLNCKI